MSGKNYPRLSHIGFTIPQGEPLIVDVEYGDRWRSILMSYAEGNLRQISTRRGDFARFWQGKNRQFTIEFVGVPFPPPAKPRFTFVDLFAESEDSASPCKALAASASSQANSTALQPKLTSTTSGKFRSVILINLPAIAPTSAYHVDSTTHHSCSWVSLSAILTSGPPVGLRRRAGTLFFNILEVLPPARTKARTGSIDSREREKVPHA